MSAALSLNAQPSTLSRVNRGEPDALLPCPACSLRSRARAGLCAPQFWNGRHSGGVMLLHCCEFSRLGSPMVLPPDDLPAGGGPHQAWRFNARILLANWWRAKRLLVESNDDVRWARQREMLQWLRENRGITPEMEELA